MSNETTTRAPADVRERVAREVFTLDADWRREYWDQFRRDFPRQAQAYYDTADRLLAILRLRDRELDAARSHARRLCVALRAIRDEAAIGGPPLESRREDWEAAMNEADEVLGELEALYGE